MAKYTYDLGVSEAQTHIFNPLCPLSKCLFLTTLGSLAICELEAGPEQGRGQASPSSSGTLAWDPEEGCCVHRHVRPMNGLPPVPAGPGTVSLTVPQLTTQRHRLSPGAWILLPAGPGPVHCQEPRLRPSGRWPHRRDEMMPRGSPSPSTQESGLLSEDAPGTGNLALLHTDYVSLGKSCNLPLPQFP